jgi:hypothetical protein
MSEGDLVWSGLEGEFVGGHGLGGGRHIFGVASESGPNGISDGRG